jgi:hypothetical protein
MKRISCLLLLIMSAFVWTSCGVYSFTGADIDYSTTKTFQVNYFQNTAANVEPGMGRDFTQQLQDLLLNQTSLDLVNTNGDLIYEGEIVQYYVAPITATANNSAAQNRLTIAINVRFYNTKDESKNFEQRFSFYQDYDGQAQLVGAALTDVINEIYERITQDVFNKSLANW